MSASLPHASTRFEQWVDAWRTSGRLVLLLDFDGTLAPIVERPELARPVPAAVRALERLRQRDDVDIAVVSGRGLADARRLAGVEGIAYAGNHGMEIDGPGVRQIHAQAEAARPLLDRVVAGLLPALAELPGAFVEDKGLTLSVHYRQVNPVRVPAVRDAVERTVTPFGELRVTEGKMVLEVRPRVEWDKGRAVEFLLQHLQPLAGTLVLYLGDDVTDEDAFRVLARWEGGRGEGVLITPEPSSESSATSYLRNPDEVAELLERLVAVT